MSAVGAKLEKVYSYFPQGKPNNNFRHEINVIGLKQLTGGKDYSSLPEITLENRTVKCGEPGFVLPSEVSCYGIHRGKDQEGTRFVVIKIPREGSDYCESVALVDSQKKT